MSVYHLCLVADAGYWDYYSGFVFIFSSSGRIGTEFGRCFSLICDRIMQAGRAVIDRQEETYGASGVERWLTLCYT